MNVRRKKGESDYQATWNLDSEEELDSNDEDEEKEFVEANQMLSSEGYDHEFAEPSGELLSRLEGTEIELTEMDAQSYAESQIEADRKDSEKDDLLFPDEVETPRDQPVRQRFAKYDLFACYSCILVFDTQ